MSFREFARPLTAIPFASSLREALCGILFHHSQVNTDGLIQKVNLLIATGQNNLAMNRAVLQGARHYIKWSRVPEGILNRLEASIRAFDPCLSCSTRAADQMPLHLQLLSADGSLEEREFLRT